MNRWLTRANQRISLTGAATLLVAASVVGQILGFLRTQVINGSFNSTTEIATDPYFAAFKIPDFFFYTITAGALGVAFMPFLADRLNKGDKEGISKLTSSLLNLMAIAMGIIGLLLLLFPKFFLFFVIHNNLTPEETNQAVMITRLIALNPLLFAISGILTSLQQTFGRFFFFALAPIVYNGFIIASVYIFRENVGLVGLGIGALAGALFQLGFVVFGLIGTGFKYTPKIYWRLEDFRHILRNLPPRSVDQGLDSINSIVETNRAATLKPGSITVYENAYTLHIAPILMVGTTIATAAFPRLNDRLAQGRPDLFRRDFLKILRVMVWIILPVAIIAFFARGYLARLIYKTIAPPELSVVLGFLVGAIIFRTIYALVSRYFYAHKDTKTPLYVSIFAIALNIYLAFTLVKSYKVAGLAIAQSIVAAAEVFVLMFIMVWRDRKIFDANFWHGIFRIIAVTGFTIMTAYTMAHLLPLENDDKGFITLGSKLAMIIIPTFTVHLAVSSLFGLEEVRPVISKLKKIILKPIRIQW